jgi:hypothetical protein
LNNRGYLDRPITQEVWYFKLWLIN